MKYFLILFLILSLISVCYADRVCFEKYTGKLIEYQSGDASLGTLTQNALNAGYRKEDIEEKHVTGDEWKAIKEEQIDKPIKEKAKQIEIKRKQKEEAIKMKLNLTEQDWENLREALN